MLPFFLYFIVYIIYATWIKKGKDESGKKWGDYGRTDLVFWIFLFVFFIYFIYFEIRVLLYHKFNFFKNFWNYFDVLSLSINMFCVISDISGLDPKSHIPVLASSVLLMWVKLVHFGRMFLSTAWMSRMIFGTVFDLKWFIIVFYLMVLGFSNVFLIISRIDYSLFVGPTFGTAFQYTYK